MVMCKYVPHLTMRKIFLTKQGLEAEVRFYQKSKGRRGKGKNKHTGSKIGFP